MTQGFTLFPGNKALEMTERPDLARESAHAIGEELLAVGINMNLAPVVDVNINPKNFVIGTRSFSDNPEVVILFGEQALEGYRQAGVISCLKHFPEHGDVEIDSHKDLPVIFKSVEELQKIELLPFAVLAKEAVTIMTAHLFVPALDPDHCSMLSKITLDYLRNQIGFEGIILSDSLMMEGVLKRCGGDVDEAALQAFNAGKNKQISEDAVNRSVERILTLKEKYLYVTPPRIKKIEHQKLALKTITLLARSRLPLLGPFATGRTIKSKEEGTSNHQNFPLSLRFFRN